MASETTPGLLALKVLTPEGSVLEGDVFEVTIPGSEGELGVLPAHAALLTRIAPGPLAYRAPEGQGAIALGRGVAEVRDDRVTVLVERAIPEEEMDAAALEAQRSTLAAELEGAALSGERIAAAEEELLLVEVQLRMVHKGPAAPAH